MYQFLESLAYRHTDIERNSLSMVKEIKLSTYVNGSMGLCSVRPRGGEDWLVLVI